MVWYKEHVWRSELSAIHDFILLNYLKIYWVGLLISI